MYQVVFAEDSCHRASFEASNQPSLPYGQKKQISARTGPAPRNKTPRVHANSALSVTLKRESLNHGYGVYEELLDVPWRFSVERNKAEDTDYCLCGGFVWKAKRGVDWSCPNCNAAVLN